MQLLKKIQIRKLIYIVLLIINDFNKIMIFFANCINSIILFMDLFIIFQEMMLILIFYFY